jgi:hypothetical protein
MHTTILTIYSILYFSQADPHDVSNFDAEFTSEAAVLTPVNTVISTVDQKEFDGFDYISEWAFQNRVAVESANVVK